MTIEELRSKIDVVDDELKKLFLERMEIAHEIGVLKANTGDTVYKPDREKAVIERLTDGVDESVKEEYTKFVTYVIQLSREHQKKMLEK